MFDDDKRRYRARNPRNPKTPVSMDEAETGNPALDGYEVRERPPLKRRRSPFHDRSHVAGSLMDEREAEFRDIYGDDL